MNHWGATARGPFLRIAPGNVTDVTIAHVKVMLFAVSKIFAIC